MQFKVLDLARISLGLERKQLQRISTGNMRNRRGIALSYVLAQGGSQTPSSQKKHTFKYFRKLALPPLASDQPSDSKKPYTSWRLEDYSDTWSKTLCSSAAATVYETPTGLLRQPAEKQGCIEE